MRSALPLTGSARSVCDAQIEQSRHDDRWGWVEVDTEDLAAAVLRFDSGTIVQWTVMSGGRGAPHAVVIK